MLQYKTPFPFSCPVSWHDVKLGQFVQACAGYIAPEKKLAVLCNLTDEQVAQLPEALKETLYENLIFCTDFSLLEAQPVPKMDVGEESYQQLLTAMMLLTGVEHIWSKAALIYALYMYPKVWRKFDFDNIKVMAAAAETRPVVEVYATCAFFFGRLTRSLMSLPPMTNHQHLSLESMMKNSAIWESCLSLMRLQVETCSSTPKSLTCLHEKIWEN